MVNATPRRYIVTVTPSRKTWPTGWHGLASNHRRTSAPPANPDKKVDDQSLRGEPGRGASPKCHGLASNHRNASTRPADPNKKSTIDRTVASQAVVLRPNAAIE